MHEQAHQRPASFYASPAEAQQAPAEEFLYVACLHEGTGVDAPDFLAVVDAEHGDIVHERTAAFRSVPPSPLTLQQTMQETTRSRAEGKAEMSRLGEARKGRDDFCGSLAPPQATGWPSCASILSSKRRQLR